MKEAKPKKLTVKERKFAEGILAGKNKTEAAADAGYKGKRNTLATLAYELYLKPHIQAYIDERMQKDIITADEILLGIKEIAVNVAEKASDRLRAYELLGKHLALFTDKQQVEHGGAMKIEIEYVDGD